MVKVRTSSPRDGDFAFEVEIRDCPAPGAAYSVRIAEGSGPPHTFLIKSREHADYIRFFGEVADAFGSRVPLNLLPREGPPSTHPYRPLLVENLSSKILYGYGDPCVFRDPRTPGAPLYLCATSNDAPDAFPILCSRSPDVWEHAGFIFPEGSTPPWAATGLGHADFWAPEIHFCGGEFRAYFVARHQTTLELCIGFARSLSPTGPFIAEPEPILQGECIDPHLLQARDKRLFLYWKEDTNGEWPPVLAALLATHADLIPQLFAQDSDRKAAALAHAMWPWITSRPTMERSLALQPLIEAVFLGLTSFRIAVRTLLATAGPELTVELTKILEALSTGIYARQLDADGLSFIGESFRVLENDMDWEAHVIEGMWVEELNGTYSIFYSGNDFSTHSYGIGVAYSDSPTGPFRKRDTPILCSTAEWTGPGHPSLIQLTCNSATMYLHGFPRGEEGYKRFRALLSTDLVFSDGEWIVTSQQSCSMR